jgi:hypothetical protein
MTNSNLLCRFSRSSRPLTDPSDEISVPTISSMLAMKGSQLRVVNANFPDLSVDGSGKSAKGLEIVTPQARVDSFAGLQAAHGAGEKIDYTGAEISAFRRRDGLDCKGRAAASKIDDAVAQPAAEPIGELQLHAPQAARKIVAEVAEVGELHIAAIFLGADERDCELWPPHRDLIIPGLRLSLHSPVYRGARAPALPWTVFRGGSAVDTKFLHEVQQSGVDRPIFARIQKYLALHLVLESRGNQPAALVEKSNRKIRPRGDSLGQCIRLFKNILGFVVD